MNLLQPQDRRSTAAGDSKTTVETRAQLLDAGVGRTILEQFARRAAALCSDDDPIVVDLGSGDGSLLAALARLRPIAGVGIDLSTAAAAHAARHVPAMTWIVANADRRLPFLDGSVQLVLSFHGRRNAAECARVLAPVGHLLVAVPAPDDLVELREAVGGRSMARSGGDAPLIEHASMFTLIERDTARERHRLGRESLLDLLRATYRGERRSEARQVAALTSMDLTLASDVFVFRPTR